MNDQEREQYRRALIDLKRQLEGQMAETGGEALRATGGKGGGSITDMPGDSGDLSVDQFHQDVALSLLEREQATRGQVDAALARIDRGTFGRCGVCGREITPERLRAVPYAAYCVDDARRAEVGKS
jgi:RNA polymerase-binding transcription factor DksA